MKWNYLNRLAQVDDLSQESNETPILIFKHSTRCSTSRMSLDRLERNWNDSELPHVKLYFLDLLTYREISKTIENKYGVEHESPQVIILRHGKAIFDCSHFAIDYSSIKAAFKN